jgi:hypothetical protein
MTEEYEKEFMIRGVRMKDIAIGGGVATNRRVARQICYDIDRVREAVTLYSHFHASEIPPQ